MPRIPIVAKCDRQRVLSSWASFCSNMIPLEFEIQFSSVRSLSPQQFVEKLAQELHVRSVIAGENVISARYCAFLLLVENHLGELWQARTTGLVSGLPGILLRW